MKLHKILGPIAALVLAFGCQQTDKTCAYPPEKIKAPLLSGQSNLVIDPDSLSSRISFTWTAVDYGYPAAVKYRLFGVYGAGEPYQIGESNSTTFTITREAFNNTVVNKKGLALPEERTSTLSMYLTASVSDTDPDYTFTSNIIAFDVTTVKSTSAPWIRRALHVRGTHQNWNDKDAPILWETGSYTDVYEGLVPLLVPDDKDGKVHFKLCPEKVGWAGNFGGDPDGMTTEDAPAHMLAEPGIYWISVTLDAAHTTGSMRLKKIDLLGVIGAAVGGWDAANDVPMTLVGLPDDITTIEGKEAAYATTNAQRWACTYASTIADIFKFRIDHDWSKPNWGGSLDALVQGGDNVQNTLEGKVRFTICFKGYPGLEVNESNPSPITGTVTQTE